MISCEWVYGITLSLIPPSRVNFQEFQGGDQPICCRYTMVVPQTPLGVLHKSISYFYKVFLDFYHQVGFEAEPWKFLNIDPKLSQGGIRLRVVR